MVIDPIEGEPEVIERALDEYGLVITGQLPIEAYTDDKLIAFELRQELMIARTRIELQKELLQLANESVREKKIQIDKLLSFVGKAIQNPSQITIQASPKAEAHISQDLRLFVDCSGIIKSKISELKEILPQNFEEVERIQDIEDSFGELSKYNSAKDVKNSSAMPKLKKLIDDVNQTGGKINSVIRGVRNGVEIAQELAKNYNCIAQWCGLPQVPKPFLKEN